MAARFSKNGSITFGNNEALNGRDNIQATMARSFSVLGEMEHKVRYCGEYFPYQHNTSGNQYLHV